MLEGAWLPSEHAGSGPGGRARVWNMERGRKSGKRGKRKAWIAQIVWVPPAERRQGRDCNTRHVGGVHQV